MSKLMVKDGDIWVPMEGLKGNTGPIPADESVPDTALVTDGAKTNTAYLMHNRLTKDAEGELISVEDAYAVPPLSLGADGVSTQVTTTGKNLFDASSANTGGYFDTSTGEYITHSSSKWVSIPLTGNASICRVKGLPNGRTTWWNDGVFIGGSGAGSGNPIDIPEGCDELRSSWFGALSNPIITIDQPIDPYEPYTGGKPAPSPEYPQEIESIDLLESTIAGKNLALFNDSVETKNANGLTFTKNRQNLKVSGSTTKWNIDSMSMTYVSKPFLKAGNKYILSLQGAYSGVVNSTFYFRTRNLGETNTTLHYPSAKNQQCAFTPTKDCIITSFVLRIGTTDGDVNVDVYPQLELGSAATEYEPYSGATALLDLSEEPLRSLPDGTKDELHLTYIRPSTRDGWAYYRGEKVKRVATRNCSGNENWKIYRNYAFYAAMPSARVMKTGKKEVLCNAYKSDASTSLGSASTSATSPNTIFGRNGEKDAIIKTIVAYNTVNDFKTALAENPITIQYPLATPETIDLGIFELPTMQSGTTHLWSDPSTNLSVTYERDRNIVITHLKAAVADLATS